MPSKPKAPLDEKNIFRKKVPIWFRIVLNDQKCYTDSKTYNICQCCRWHLMPSFDIAWHQMTVNVTLWHKKMTNKNWIDIYVFWISIQFLSLFWTKLETFSEQNICHPRIPPLVFEPFWAVCLQHFWLGKRVNWKHNFLNHTQFCVFSKYIAKHAMINNVRREIIILQCRGGELGSLENSMKKNIIFRTVPVGMFGHWW